VLGRSLAQTNTTVSGNVVSGTGPSNQYGIGIYLDDNASGVTVSGNLVTNVGSDTFRVHGDNDNTIHSNIFDLGTEPPSAGLFQSDTTNQPNPNALINNVDRLNTFITRSAPSKSPNSAAVGALAIAELAPRPTAPPTVPPIAAPTAHRLLPNRWNRYQIPVPNC